MDATELEEKAKSLAYAEKQRAHHQFKEWVRPVLNSHNIGLAHPNGNVIYEGRRLQFLMEAIKDFLPTLVQRANVLEERDYQRRVKELKEASLEYGTGMKLNLVTPESDNEDECPEMGRFGVNYGEFISCETCYLKEDCKRETGPRAE